MMHACIDLALESCVCVCMFFFPPIQMNSIEKKRRKKEDAEEEEEEEEEGAVNYRHLIQYHKGLVDACSR